MPRLAPGPARLGRYELLIRLGRGGMAELFLARLAAGHEFAKPVALKRILPHLADDPAFVALFLNESRIAARLAHPNVCSVHELIEHDGERALVMEYLEGVSWDVLAAAAPRDRFGARLAASVLAQACEGLHHAHTFHAIDGAPRGVVHRDVSPQNLFVTREGVCKVLDFGVSKMAGDPQRTATGVRKGKLPYMAPEQLRGEQVDARADVWALGAVLWEALAGRRLFDRATDFLTYEAIHGAAIPALGGAPEIERVLGPVIRRALQRASAARYATARGVGHDLQRAAEALGGVLSHAEIADALRALCSDELAARQREVRAALAGTPPPAPVASVPVAAATISVALRDRSLVEHGARSAPRKSRRWRLAAPALVALVIAGGLALRAADRGAADTERALPARAPASTASPSLREVPAPVVPAPATVVGAPAAVVGAPAAVVGAPAAVVGAPAAVVGAPAESDAPPVVARAPAGSAALLAVRATPAGARSPARRLPPAASVAPAARARGYYAVDSRPYASIFVDGAAIGDTPLFRVPLAAGSHVVRAVLADGRQRTFPVQIAADRVASSVLTW